MFHLGRHFTGVVTRTQAVFLIRHDLQAPVPANIPLRIRQTLENLTFPDISDLNISILKKSKEQKCLRIGL